MSSSQPPRKLKAEMSIEEAIAAKRSKEKPRKTNKVQSPTVKKNVKESKVAQKHDELMAALNEYDDHQPALLEELREKTEELAGDMMAYLELFEGVSKFIKQAEAAAEQAKEDARQQAEAEAQEIVARAEAEALRSKQELQEHSAQLLSELHGLVEGILASADDPRQAARDLKLVADRLRQRTDNL